MNHVVAVSGVISRIGGSIGCRHPLNGIIVSLGGIEIVSMKEIVFEE